MAAIRTAGLRASLVTKLSWSSALLEKTELKRDKAFVVRGALSHRACRALIAATEAIGYEPAPVDMRARRIAGSDDAGVMRTDIRNNEKVDCDDPELANELFARLASTFPPEFVPGGGRLAGQLLRRHSFSERVRFYKYGPGASFKPHSDGAIFDPETESHNIFTVLVYLNAVTRGGATIFHQTKGLTSVTPEPGLALAFYRKLLHEGELVHDGLKYVMRLDAMYQAARTARGE
mmetsp:Transcript_23186/g.71266  ORF Transcript_23186/g.71266 Transcript_23186/m.71266 type:complete len:234 (-) Transcript_23186:1068-1769(-)